MFALWFLHRGGDQHFCKHSSAGIRMQLLEPVIIQKPSLHLESGKLGCFPGVVAMEGKKKTGSVWNCRTHDTLLRCKFVWLWWSFSSQSHFCQWGRVKVSQALRNFSGCETRVCSSWLQKNVRKEKCNIGRSNSALAPANCSLHPTNVIIYTNFHTFPGFGQNDKAFRSGLQFPEHLAEGLTVKLFRVFFFLLNMRGVKKEKYIVWWDMKQGCDNKSYIIIKNGAKCSLFFYFLSNVKSE